MKWGRKRNRVRRKKYRNVHKESETVGGTKEMDKCKSVRAEEEKHDIIRVGVKSRKAL